MMNPLPPVFTDICLKNKALIVGLVIPCMIVFSPQIAEALPKSSEVVSGEAKFSCDSQKMIIQASDKAIINYNSFNIAETEIVEFIQPSASSTALNRVTGGDPSSILGSLQSNGKIFLVNPNGVYFGPEATVSTGSLVVSTLDISNEDFLSERYQFKLNGAKGEIVNKGVLSSPEGSVALLAPRILNEGTITTKIGQVFIGGAEKITLDFSGDGLLSFALEGEIEEAVIKNKGIIEAAQGNVTLRLKAAHKAIKDIINTDGIEVATHMIEEGGIIELVNESQMIARNISIEGGSNSSLLIAGDLNASSTNPGDRGGSIQLLADAIDLRSAHLDASGDSGGGTILIGGDYQGSGDLHRATWTHMDEHSTIHADALTKGDGGRVILWSDDKALFNGKIFARGGAEGGNGGFVETSGKIGLGVLTGHVNTLAPYGKAGQWLMDPLTITVETPGATGTLPQAADCTDSTTNLIIAPATINVAASDVILCASKSITVNESIAMTHSNIGLTFTADNGAAPTTGIFLGLAGTSISITTQSGQVQFNGDVTLVGAGQTIDIDTTAAGLGGNVTFTSRINPDAASAGVKLTITAGSGSVLVGNAINGTGTVQMGTVSVTANGGIVLHGLGQISFPTGSATFTSTSGITLNNSYAADGLTFNGDVTLGTASTFTIAGTNTANVTVSGSIDGAFNLTVNNNKTGNISLKGAIGSNTALGTISLNTTVGNIVLGSIGIDSASGAASLSATTTGAGTITLNGGTYFTSGAQTYNAPVIVGANTTLKTTNTAISFSNTVDALNSGVQGLILDAGTSTVTFGLAVGNTTPLNYLTVSGSGGIHVNNTTPSTATFVTTLNNQLFNHPVTIGAPATFTSNNNGSIIFESTIDSTSAQRLEINAGNGTTVVNGNIGSSATQAMGAIDIVGNAGIVLNGVGTGTSTLGAFQLNATGSNGGITLNGASIYRVESYNVNGNIILGTAGTTTLSTVAGNSIFIDGNIDGVSSGSCNFTATTTSGGVITITGALGANIPLGALSLGSSTAGSVTLGAIGDSVSGASSIGISSGTSIILNGGTYFTGSGQVYTGPVQLGTTTYLNSNNQLVSFSSTINGAQGLTIDAGVSTVTFGSTVGNSSALTSLTVSGSGGITFNNGVNPTTITTTDDQLFNHAVTIGANATFTSTNSRSIIFDSTINGSTPNLNLTVNAGIGTVFVHNVIGSTATAMGAITITGTSGITLYQIGTGTAAGAVFLEANKGSIKLIFNTYNALSQTYNGNITIGGDNVTITSNGGAAQINGSVDTDGEVLSLTINSGGGAILIGGEIGTTVNSVNGVTLNAGTGTISIGAVGSGATPGSTNGLNLTGNGGITLNGGTYLTTNSASGQAYNGPVILGATTALTSTDQPITFSSTINGTQGLTIDAGTSTVTFGGAIGNLNPITNLTVSGSGGINVNTTGITTNNNQLFNHAVILGANATFTSNGIDSINFQRTINGNAANRQLIISTGNGTVNAGGIIGSTTTAMGAITITGNGGITLSGIGFSTTPATGAVTLNSSGTGGIRLNEGNYNALSHTYNGDVVFGANTIVTSSGSGAVVTINGSVDADVAATRSLSISSNNGAITILGATGTINSLNGLTLNAGTGAIAIDAVGDTTTAGSTSGLSLTGTAGITLNGGTYLTSGATQAYNSLVTLGTTTAITSTGQTITFSSTINGTQGLTIDAGTSTVTFGGAIGNLNPITNLTVSGSGGIIVNTTGITTNNNQLFNHPVTLGANATFTSNGVDSINFQRTINSSITPGAHLTISTGNGTVNVGGIIGSTATAMGAITITGNGGITLSGIGVGTPDTGAVILNSSGTGGIRLNEGNYNALSHTYNGDVVFGASTTVTSNNAVVTINGSVDADVAASRSLTINSGGGAITINGATGTINSLNGLTLNAGSATIAIGPVGGTTAGSTSGFSLTGTTGITLNGGTYFTSGASGQAYNSPVILGANTALTSTSQPISFSSTINGTNGTQGLTIDAGNNAVTFGSTIGNSSALTNLTVSGSSGINVNTTAVTTSNNQLFNHAVILGANATFTSSSNGSISFESTINGSSAGEQLTIVAGTGTASILGAIGSTATAIGAISITGNGGITLNGIGTGTAATGAVTLNSSSEGGIRLNQGTYNALSHIYNGDVVLGATTTITSNAAVATINGSIDGDTAGTRALTINSGNGAITIGGSIGTINNLSGLTFNAGTGAVTMGAVGNTVAGSTGGMSLTGAAGITLNGGTYLTSGASQSLNSPVTLGTSTALTSTNQPIAFSSTINGTQGLTVNAGTNSVTFGSTIGNSSPLTNLTVSGSGGINVTTTTVTTSNNQLFNHAVTLGANATFTSSSNGSISFESTINGSSAGQQLTIAAGAGTASVLGAIGSTATAVGAISITGNGGITLSGIGVGTPDTGAVTLNSSGTGGIRLNEGNYNALSHTYNGDVVIGANTTVTSNNAVVTINGSVDGDSIAPRSLTINSGGGAITINGATGTINSLNGLTLNAGTGAIAIDAVGSTTAGSTSGFSLTGSTGITLNGGTYLTSGAAQAYNSPAILGASTTLTSTNQPITFSSTLNGAQGLNINTGTGALTFTGNVGATTPLQNVSISAANGVTASGSFAAASLIENASTGANSFSGAVSTSGSAGIILNGSTISFGSTVTTTNNGSLLLTNSGQLTLPNAAFNIGGSFSQLGAGTVSTGAAITTANGDISFASAVTLTGTSAFNSSGTNKNITFSSSIDGTEPLSFTAGTGNVTLTGAVGNTTAVGAITIASSANFTASEAVNGIKAASITQTTGSGLTSFAGPLNLSATGITSLNLTGDSFTISKAVTTGNNASVLINNSGLLTLPSTTSFNLLGTGSFQQTGTGSVSTGANVTTAGQQISYAGPVTLTANIVQDNGSAGAISFGSTIDGNQNLTINAHSGAFSITGAVGSVARLGTLLINNASGVTANSIVAAAINEAATTGANVFSGTLNTNTASGIVLRGTTITLGGNVDTTAGGPLTITNTGLLTVSPGVDITLTGPLTQTGGGAVSLATDIATSSQLVSFANGVTLAGATTINTTSANITFSSTVDGNNNLALTAGSGALSFGGNVGAGTPLNALTIASAGSVTASGSLSALSLVENASTGANSFVGAVSTSGSAGIILNGSTISFGSTVTTTNNGSLLLTNSGLLALPNAAFNIGGSFSQLGAGNVSTGAAITTANGDISFNSAVTLTATSAFNSSGTNKNITFSSTIDGTIAGAQPLSFTAGTGNVTLTGAVGNTTAVGAITIASSSNFTASEATNGIKAASITQTAGSGLTSFAGPLNLSATGTTSLSLTGNSFTINKTGTTGNNASVLINNSGLLTLPSTTSFSLSGTGSFQQTGTGSVSTGANVTTAGQQISYAGPVTLTANIVQDNGSVGAISFGSTIDGNQNLTINAHSGPFSVTGAVGSVTRLGTLLINNASGVTAANISAAAINEAAATGANSFTGTLNTNTASGIVLNGSTITLGGNVVTTAGGPLTITNTGLFTVSPGVDITLTGPMTQTGGGAVSLATNIATSSTSSQFVSFANAVTLAGATTINTTNANITFSSTVDGSNNLSLTAGTGAVSFGNNVGAGTALGALTIASANGVTASGSLHALSLTENAATGANSFVGAVSTTGSAGIALSGSTISFGSTVTTTNNGPLLLTNSGLLTLPNAAFNIGGSFSQLGAGSVSTGAAITTANGDISFASAVTLTGTSAFNSSGTNKNITFSSTIDGAQDLSFTAGAGNVTLAGAVGSTNRVGAITIASSSNFTASEAVNGIKAASITQTAGSGLTLFEGPLDLNAIGITSLNLTGNSFTINKTVTTGNNASVLINNSGLLTLPSTTSFSLLGTGSFQQTGTGSVLTGANVTTAGQQISYAGPVTLTANIVQDNGSAGAISFGSTIDGSHSLTINAHNGSFSATGAVGSVTRLGTLLINNANGVTASSISAAAINEAATTGANVFSGTLNTNTASGIVLRGTTITLGGNVDTTAGGPLTITNTGLLTVSSGVDITLTGPMTQTGGGAVSLATDIRTSSQLVSFTNGVTLAGATTIDTTSADITFSSTVDGGNNLSLTAGSGAISFGGNVGAGTRLGTLTILSGGSVTAASITAAAINETASTGANGFSGTIDTNGAAGIILNGSTISFSNAVNTTSGGSLAITNSSTLTMPDGVLFTIDNAFSQTGGGAVSTGTSITTATGGISIDGATTLTGSISLDSSGAAKNINFASSINGNSANTRDITFIAGAGNISLTGAIGNTTPLRNIVITSAGNVTASNAASGITATSLTQTNGTGLSSFAGPISLSGTGTSLNLTGDSFTLSKAVTTVSNASASITNTGLLTLAPAATFNLTGTGSFQQLGGGAVMTGTNITTVGQQISFSGPVTLTTPTVSPITLNTGTGGGGAGPIRFDSTIDGGQDLKLNADTGAVTLTGAVGSATRLGILTIQNAGTVTTNSITAAQIDETANTGADLINGALDTNTVAGITLNGNTITLNGSVRTTGGGPLAITNTGQLSITAGADITLTGPFTQVGGGNVLLATDIRTASQIVSFANSVSLSGPTTINTANTGGGAGITFSSTLDGANNLGITAGTGALLFTGNVGNTSRLGILTIANAGSVTANGTLHARAIEQTANTGANSFSGVVDTNTVAGIILNGSTITFANPATTTNNGPLLITNTGVLTLPAATFSIGGGFSQLGSGSVSSAANITTGSGGISFNSAVTATGDFTLDSSASKGGDIQFINTLSGSHNIVLDAGIGNILFNQAVGSLTTLTATAQAIDQNSTLQATGAIDLIANLILTNNATLTAGGNASITGTINSDTTNRNFSISAGGTATLGNTIGAIQPLQIFTVNANSIAISDIGSSAAGVSGTTTLTATNGINFSGVNYVANQQNYTGTSFNLVDNTPTTFTALTNSIQFTTGAIMLGNKASLIININTGTSFSAPKITGNGTQSLFTFCPLGTIAIGHLDPLAAVYQTATSLSVSSPIDASSVTLIATAGDILNVGGPWLVNATDYITMNAIGGSVGSAASPISIQTNGPAFAGAGVAAYFSGSTGDSTVHCLPSNPPPTLVFNLVNIKCSSKPVPPTPTPCPPCICPSKQHHHHAANDGHIRKAFYVAGIYSYYYTLVSDIYILKDEVNEKSLQAPHYLFYGTQKPF